MNAASKEASRMDDEVEKLSPIARLASLVVVSVGQLTGFALVIASMVVMKVLRFGERKLTQPKGYVTRTAEMQHEEHSAPMIDDDITKDEFNVDKVPDDVDYVVVGSGAGPLYCAALLAKVGKKVLVLEQHSVSGGCTHSFEDHGFNFDSGVHYVGERELLESMLSVVTDEPIRFAQLGSEDDGYCYDEIQLGSDMSFKFCAGEDAYIKSLTEQFPSERAGIIEWLRLCKRARTVTNSYMQSKLLTPTMQFTNNSVFCLGEYYSLAAKTASEVAASVTKDKRLQALLCSQFGCYGLPPDRASFLVQAAVTTHYLDGAYYPVGGAQSISKALVRTITKSGGRVLVNALVTDIDVFYGRAVGVRVVEADTPTATKHTVRAKLGVISGGGARITRDLVPESYRKQFGYDALLKEVGPSSAHIQAFIGLEGTTESLGITSRNLHLIPVAADDASGDYRFSMTERGVLGGTSADVGVMLQAHSKLHGGKSSGAAAVKQKTKVTPTVSQTASSTLADIAERQSPESNRPALFPIEPLTPVSEGSPVHHHLDFNATIMFPSAKDPTSQERFPNQSTCIISTPVEAMQTQWFQPTPMPPPLPSPPSYLKVSKEPQDESILQVAGVMTSNVDDMISKKPLAKGKTAKGNTKVQRMHTKVEVAGKMCEELAHQVDAVKAQFDHMKAEQTHAEHALLLKKVKKELYQKLKQQLYRAYPKTQGQIRLVRIGTPLTQLHCFNRMESYGLEHSPKRFLLSPGGDGDLRPQTKIDGLLITGQDIVMGGVMGALNAGLLTAHAALGYGFWDIFMTGRNLITDLQQLEKKKNKELEIKVKKAMTRAGSGGMVEAFQEKVAGAGAGLMARVKAGAGAVAERVKSERDQVEETLKEGMDAAFPPTDTRNLKHAQTPEELKGDESSTSRS